MQNSEGKVGSLSSRHLVVTNWMDRIEMAFQRMTAIHTRHLPVVDDNGAIIGMLSDRDVNRAMQIDQPDFTSGKSPKAEFDPNARVRDYMSWPIETIHETQTIAQAARIMIEKKISALIVSNGQFAVGVVTTEDLLKALLNDHQSPLQDVKFRVAAAVYDSPIAGVAQSLATVGL